LYYFCYILSIFTNTVFISNLLLHIYYCQYVFDKYLFVCYTTYMDTLLQTLRHAGLTEPQALIYVALLQHGPLSPAQLAKQTGESRTNAYMLCDKLSTLGIALKVPGKKLLYEAAHPATLETLAEKRRKQLQRSERVVHENVSSLIDIYFESRDTPGVVTRFGKDGIEQVYQHILKDGHNQEYLQSPHDGAYMGEQFYQEFGKKRIAAGIKSRVISVADKKTLAAHTPQRETAEGISERTWLQEGEYTAPVEWVIQGSTVSAITFTEQPIVLTIHSSYIAESMRQLFELVRKSSK